MSLKTRLYGILQLHAHGTKHYAATILQLNTCKHMEQETSTTKTVSFSRLDVEEDILVVHNSEPLDIHSNCEVTSL